MQHVPSVVLQLHAKRAFHTHKMETGASLTDTANYNKLGELKQVNVQLTMGSGSRMLLFCCSLKENIRETKL